MGFAILLGPGWAQQGDREGHEMAPPPEAWNLPAPVLSPEEALESFRFADDGFVLELVAAEPLVSNPVCLAFDGNGRPWVCEMRDYMPNVDGTDEDARTGVISVLLDHDGDGQADEAKVFLDGLYQPRAIQFVAGGILWGDEEKLYFTERLGAGGLEAGETVVVDDDWAPGGNVEHKSNGLVYGMDNWLYTAKNDFRYRLVDGAWVKDKTEFRGQWGIAQDDFGRLVANTNSNLVSMEMVHPGVVSRNSNHRFHGATEAKMSNAVHPIRITAGVNRGYMEGTLDERGYLASATAAGGLTVYRGDNFPAEYDGNLFIPEPAGMLVKRAILEEKDGFITAKAAYPDREFIASMDERNRFVNSFTAPDGTLYLVDLYHGIVQHRTYVTTYLRNQILKRGLDKDNAGGRVYRVRWAATERGELPEMEGKPATELAAYLSHPNGWWRDTAQRLIVESGDGAAAGALREVLKGEGELARIHAIWALAGLGQLTADDVAVAAGSAWPQVTAQALRAAETKLGGSGDGALLELVESLPLEAVGPAVRYGLASLLGQFRGAEQTGALQILTRLLGDLDEGPESTRTRDLAMSGLGGAEMTFLPVAAAANLEIVSELVGAIARSGNPKAVEEVFAWLKTSELSLSQRESALRKLAQAVVEQRQSDLATMLLAHALAESPDRGAIRRGMADGSKGKGFKKLVVYGKPASLSILEKEDESFKELNRIFEVKERDLTDYLADEKSRHLFEVGQVEYARLCAACHQPNGQGMVAMAPPLVESEWVMGSDRRLIALVMDGVMGPIEVAGIRYEAPEIQPVMPGMRFNPELDDEEIAGILTYIRNSWGNAGKAVEPEVVAAWRNEEPARAPFTAEELMEIH